MFKSVKEGMFKGIGLMIVFSTAVFAINVSGTIKTWTSGETLTATDLNTTVQSLKTAVESATQLVEFNIVRNTHSNMSDTSYGALTSGIVSPTVVETTMSRSGVVKNAKVNVLTLVNVGYGCVYTLTKNGADTNISISVPNNTAVSTIEDSDTVSFAKDDKLGWKSFCSGGGMMNTSPNLIISFEF